MFALGRSKLFQFESVFYLESDIVRSRIGNVVVTYVQKAFQSLTPTIDRAGYSAVASESVISRQGTNPCRTAAFRYMEDSFAEKNAFQRLDIGGSVLKFRTVKYDMLSRNNSVGRFWSMAQCL